jgi:hypothetical protein
LVSGIARGEVAGWTGRMPRVAETQREPLVPVKYVLGFKYVFG